MILFASSATLQAWFSWEFAEREVHTSPASHLNITQYVTLYQFRTTPDIPSALQVN